MSFQRSESRVLAAKVPTFPSTNAPAALDQHRPTFHPSQLALHTLDLPSDMRTSSLALLLLWLAATPARAQEAGPWVVDREGDTFTITVEGDVPSARDAMGTEAQVTQLPVPEMPICVDWDGVSAIPAAVTIGAATLTLDGLTATAEIDDVPYEVAVPRRSPNVCVPGPDCAATHTTRFCGASDDAGRIWLRTSATQTRETTDTADREQVDAERTYLHYEHVLYLVAEGFTSDVSRLWIPLGEDPCQSTMTESETTTPAVFELGGR
ncbi:MAG: hypothetical protein KDA28_02070, partial [Phycisphaerales bacterium]|nr:hypothetical protein [Phycisphaerales bacterium]